jgi:GNAT superfamily N-acetyltransferase
VRRSTSLRPISANPQRHRDVAARALAWTRWQRDSICDQIEPWEHGSVLRTPRYPTWFEASLVRVEDDPGMTMAELVAFADRALAGFGHRLISFEVAEAGAALPTEFQAAGWRTHPLVYMHHEGLRPSVDDAQVREVPYDAVEHLRRAWHHEDFPSQDPTEFHADMREVRLARGDRTLAVHDAGEPIAYAALDSGENQVEVGAVYVLPQYRGGGRGTALTRAAIAAAGDVDDVWICADAEDRPRHLYARLGFRPVLHTMDFLRLP